MFLALQIATLLLVAIAMALALSHALELPGKRRLPKDQYLAVQTIYDPGFTIAGMAEPVGLVATLALMLLTPAGTASFWLTAGAFATLSAMYAAYWLLTHPVDDFWREDLALKAPGSGLLGVGATERRQAHEPDWVELRDRWEFSQVLRAAFGVASLTLLAAALAL